MSSPFNPADPRNVVDPSRKDSLATWQAFFGMLEQSTDRYTTRSDWGKAPADEAFVYAAVRVRALSASSAPLRVYVRKGNDLVPANLTDDAAAKELQELLDFVNPDTMSSADMKATVMASLSIYGEAYLVKTRGRLGGKPQELHFLNPSVVTPVMGDRWIDKYEYRPLGTTKTATYLPKDIIAFRAPGNFMDPTRGLSPMAAIRNEISTSRMASEHTNNQLRNHGVPAGVWVVPKDSDITPQDQSSIRRVLNSLRGPRNAGKTAVLPGGMTWQSLGMPEQDAQYLNARKVSRMAISAAFGIPPALMGDTEHTGVYRSIRDAEEIFWRRFAAELEWVSSVFDSWLVPEFDKTQSRLCVRFDLTGIEALKPTITEQASLWQGMLDRGVVTINEARLHFSVGDPVEWGDKPLKVPDTKEEAPAPAQVEPIPEGQPVDPAEAQPIVPVASLAIKHADHDQSDHGNRDGGSASPRGDYYERMAAHSGAASDSIREAKVAVDKEVEAGSAPHYDHSDRLRVIDDFINREKWEQVREYADVGSRRAADQGYSNLSSRYREIANTARTASRETKSLPVDLYKHPAVKAFLAGAPLDATSLLGVAPNQASLKALEVGIRRRYSAKQITDGVPSEGYAGLVGENR